MTTWLTSTRKRSSKRNSTSVIGFGPKNGVQATSSSSRGDSSSPSSSRKTLPISGGGTSSSSSNKSMLISGSFRHSLNSNDSLSMQKLTKKTLSHRHVNIWNQITTSQKYMQTATCTTLKKNISFDNSRTSCWDLCSKAMPTLLHNPLDCHLWQRVMPTTKCLTKSWLM